MSKLGDGWLAKALVKDVADDGRHLLARGREAIRPQLRDELPSRGNDPPTTVGTSATTAWAIARSSASSMAPEDEPLGRSGREGSTRSARRSTIRMPHAWDHLGPKRCNSAIVPHEPAEREFANYPVVRPPRTLRCSQPGRRRSSSRKSAFCEILRTTCSVSRWSSDVGGSGRLRRWSTKPRRTPISRPTERSRTPSGQPRADFRSPSRADVDRYRREPGSG